MPSQNFDPYNETSLDMPMFVLRDSLGVLAIHILSAKKDISRMKYDDVLHDLLDIITELHEAYDRIN